MIQKGVAFAGAYIGVSQIISKATEALRAFDEEAKNRAQLTAGLTSTKIYIRSDYGGA